VRIATAIIILYYAERQHKITAVRNKKIQKAKTIKANTIKLGTQYRTFQFRRANDSTQ